MAAGLVFVGALGLCNLLLLLLIARRVRRIARRAEVPPRPWLPPGTLVPDFTTVTTAGDRLSLDDLRGQQSLVGIFSTTCEPCVVQVPVFAAHAASEGGPSRVIAVVIGTAEQASDYMAILDGKVTIVCEERYGPVAMAFSARAYPSIYLLDDDGRVIAGGASVVAVTGARADALAGRR